LIRQWWNGKFGRLARRVVIVWASEDRLRWMVEARRGGSEGRLRFRGVPNGHDAFALAALWRSASQLDEWTDFAALSRRQPKRDDQG
jgi:hypothetical protein